MFKVLMFSLVVLFAGCATKNSAIVKQHQAELNRVDKANVTKVFFDNIEIIKKQTCTKAESSQKMENISDKCFLNLMVFSPTQPLN